MNSRFRRWSDLLVFLAVYREGSTLAASKVIGMSQPTVARRVDTLEHALGLTLFERGTRGFEPTADAKALLTLAEKVEAAVMEFERHAMEMSQIKPIRITAYTANFSPAIIEIFSDFSELNPDVPFEFLDTTRVLDLIKGEADIALRITRAPLDPALICRHISTAKFTLYGVKQYKDRYGFPSSPAEMKTHKLVSFLRDDTPPRFHDWMVKHAGEAAITQTMSEMGLIMAAVKSGRGLSIQNVKWAQNHPELIPCFDPPAEFDAEHHILVSPQAYKRKEVRAFVKFFAPRYAKIFR